MPKLSPKSKKIFTIVITIIIVILLLSVGVYYIYQLHFVPKLTKLSIPTTTTPGQCVMYLYTLQVEGTVVIFGDEKMSSSQVTSELQKDMRAIKSAGFDGVKISYYFKATDASNYLSDRIALRASQQGLYPVGIIQGHRSKPKDRSFNKEELEEWKKFVFKIVSQNKNIIYFWEIWNEPSLDLFKYGSPEEFTELLKITYPIIKQANPNAKVIVTLSAEGKDSSGFEDKVLALGGGNYFDILSFHPYAANPYLQEEIIREAIKRQKELVLKYDNRWPLIISEIGQPVSEVSEEEQAGLGKFLYEEASKNNIPVTWFYWSDQRLPKDFRLHDGSNNWGLIRYDGTPRPILNEISIYLESEI